MTNDYDAIVIGLGAMGSATAAHLARRGYRVLGLDAYHRGHTLGSSHGTSRIIREAYFEDPAYVPLVQRAYTLWRDLERLAARPLLTITGGLVLGPRDGVFVDGAIRSASQHGLRHELLAKPEVEARFAGLRVPDGMVGVLEPNAGILHPEQCIAAHLDVAARNGADLHHREPAVGYRVESSGITVGTVGARYRAQRLVITTGPWATELLADAGIPLTVKRVVNVHFQSTRPELFARDRCPVVLWELPEGRYYAVPGTPPDPLKFGRHDDGEICTPHTIRREVDDVEVASLRMVLDRYMPGASGPVARAFTCMYTLTPDEHFVLDKHPLHDQVVFACGFSGHGFKFAAVVGEILADLAVDGSTRHDIRFLSVSRFSSPGKQS
jgi:sarcosine oxidase